MDSLDLKAIFFEALNFPEYAWPNFFIYKQRLSKWDKGVYLHSLAEVYHACIERLQINHNANKRKNPHSKLDNIIIPIKDVTGGVEVGNFNKQIIDKLFLGIQSCYYYDRVQNNFSNIEILSFVEHAIGFIRNEFRFQTKESNDFFFSRSLTKTYCVYLIAQDAPFFDFPKFKHAIRELLLFCPNKENLKNILKKYHKASKEIVDLWNDKVFIIEENVHNNGEYKTPDTVRVEFRSDELSHTWWNDANHFDVLSPKHFRNQDFANYAAKVANLIATEVLEIKNNVGLEVRNRKEYLKLEDLFIDKNEFNDCIEIFRKVKPIVLSLNNEFLLSSRSKGVFVAWIDVLKGKGKLYLTTRENLSGLINDYFKGVDFGKSGKTFSNSGTTSYKKYYKQIVQLLE